MDQAKMCRILAKVIMLGDSGVGKSSILLRITNHDFQYNNLPTIGVDFGSIMINLPNHSVKMQFWDAAGQERFRSIVRNYYRNSSVVILVFDLSCIKSLINLRDWIDEIKRIRGISDNGCWPLFYLVGNKADLQGKQMDFKDHIETLTSQVKFCAYREISAKTGQDIDLLIREIAQEIVSKVRTAEAIDGIYCKEIHLDNGGKLQHEMDKPKTGCCLLL